MNAEAEARLAAALDGLDLEKPNEKEILLTKAAVTTATEQGTFTAVISTERTDREGDVVVPDAMVNALQAWGANGKMVPLAWQHRTEPDELIGHIDPNTVKAVGGEVVADGWVDRDTPRGKQVWRLVKSNTLGFSFGYLVVDAVKNDDGTREIRALDVFEVSATVTPMNADTRVVSWKASEPEPEREPADLQELQARCDEVERELGLDPDLVRADDVEDPAMRAFREEMRTTMLRLMGNGNGTDTEKALTPEQLKAKCDDTAKQLAPIQVATFEC